MSETGILMYDLAGNWCEKCGRPKMDRLLGMLTGCATCDEVITRHRCTARPDLDDIAVGDSWECRDCGSVWSAGLETKDCPDCCSGCGHRVTVKRWFVIEGDRIGAAPRHEPQPWTPFGNALRATIRAAYARPEPPSLGACYTMPNGSEVHVKPGCRCKR